MEADIFCTAGPPTLHGPRAGAYRAYLLVSWLFGVVAANTAQAALLRIMPLGDSITVGIGDGNNGGYRGPLYQGLTGSGYAVDFVGSQTGGSIPDPNHEGHSGWRADQIRDNISGWLTSHPADIVLLHIGTNDITQGENAEGIIVEIEQILSRIDLYESAHEADITVVIARIINRSNPQDALGIKTSALNNLIGSMAATRIAAGDRLVVVDHEGALSYPGDLVDAVHPNASGYGKMATVWLDALTLLLRNRGDFISDTIPTMMMPGVSYDCSITMQNTGCQPWLCSPNGTALTVAQTDGPVSNQLIPYPYHQVYTNPCEIGIWQNCTFPFTIDVPADTPLGQYQITWQMKDDEEWFDSDWHDALFVKSVAVRLYPIYRGDLDDDGDVDQEDFGRFQICLTGSGNPQDDPNCQVAKFDGDSDVDDSDLAVLLDCMSGANVFPDPSCVN